MSNTSKLLFFNKNGYPYNFQLVDNIWTGKVYFEPNCTNLYKTLSFYTLESVDSMNLSFTGNIYNKEIYNNDGMTFSKFTYSEIKISNIRAVNNSSEFYSKWIYGNGLNKKFPIGTVIYITTTDPAFSTYINKYYTVVNTTKNAIMIIDHIDNSTFNLTLSDAYTYTISSKSCISVPDNDRSLLSTFNIVNGEKVSIVGSQYNDGVYEVDNVYYGTGKIEEYNLSNFVSDDTMIVNVYLYTERPQVYVGGVNIKSDGNNVKITFDNGLNSNLVIGSQIIFEDGSGNHLLNGNYYNITDIIKTESYLVDNIVFSEETYTEDDGDVVTEYFITMPKTFVFALNDKIQFIGNGKNNKITRTIKRVTSDVSNYIYQLNDVVYSESAKYTIIKNLSTYQINSVVATPSIDSSTYNGDAYVFSTSNILSYEQVISEDGYSYTIDRFIDNYSDILQSYGVDTYKYNNLLYFESMYFGSSRYYDVRVFRKHNAIVDIVTNTDGSTTNIYELQTTEINPLGNYMTNNTTNIYNILLNSDYKISTYERANLSNELSIPFHADVILNLADDYQNYGFMLVINSVQYYIGFENDGGTTSQTYQTILSFLSKYQTIFENNGISLSSARILNNGSYEEHLYIDGIEPNVDISSFSVKVNKNSSYIINESNYNKYMMVTANKIETSAISFTDMMLSTGMIVSINGSKYTANNKEFNIIGLASNKIELSFQGAMYSDTNVTLTLKTREYLRRPRESNSRDISYRYRWLDDDDDSIFIFDLSGQNLEPYNNVSELEYTGVKPLNTNIDELFFNTVANSDITKIDNPLYQQTVFEQVEFSLEKFNSDNLSILPKPIETFIAYRSKLEGVNTRTLVIERVDNITFSGSVENSVYFVAKSNTLKLMGTTSNKMSFLNNGIRPNRYVRMKFEDNDVYSKAVYENYQDLYITNVSNYTITFSDDLVEFDTSGKTISFTFEMLPETLAKIDIYGETETEDERFENNLKILGIDLTEEDEYIFDSSDVKEDGTDYRLLNRKRKEMFNTFPEIYNYIGSYKAILNAIDFFGYEDVQLMEYFKNIDEESPLYGKLKQVLVPDLTDRSVDGWEYPEDLSNRVDYIKTNFFNLTYRITDEEGNNVQVYSLDEVQIKLNGLKEWLRKNVIPINCNIRDITGLSESSGVIYRRFDSSVNITKQISISSVSAVNFNYVLTQNFNSSWFVSVRFYCVDASTPEFFDLKVITYSKDSDTGKLYQQQRYEIFKTDLTNFNFTLNWDDDNKLDHYFYVETRSYNSHGVSQVINKMYNLQDGESYIFDEFKNYTLVNNVFKYKKETYFQDIENVYIIDGDGNIYVIEK